MSDSFLNNLDTREKQNLYDALGAAQSATGTFADVAGDSFTGLVNFTTLTSTGNASLSSAQIPTLTSTRAVFTSLASLAQANIFSTVNTAPALTITSTVLAAGATTAPLNIVASGASQAFISFSGVFISSASYTAASTNAFVIPVYHETQRVWGYIGASKLLL